MSCICIVVLCVGIFPINVFADFHVPRGAYVDYLTTSNYSGAMNSDISIKNGILTVNLNDPSAKDGTGILLDCSCGHEDWKTLYQHSGTLVHDLRLHPEGTFEIRLYKGVTYGTRSLKSFKQMEQVVKEIIKDCVNDEQKALAIHDWLASNLSYDNVALLNHDLDDASDPEKLFTSKIAVCSGYARLARIFYGIAEIPCVNVCGFANGYDEDSLIEGQTYDESNHEWNAIYVNDKWQIIDITWDSPNKYYGKDDTKNISNKPAEHTYYMISPVAFGAEHFSVELYETRNENYIETSEGDVYRIIDPKKQKLEML